MRTSCNQYIDRKTISATTTHWIGDWFGEEQDPDPKGYTGSTKKTPYDFRRTPDCWKGEIGPWKNKIWFEKTGVECSRH